MLHFGAVIWNNICGIDYCTTYGSAQFQLDSRSRAINFCSNTFLLKLVSSLPKLPSCFGVHDSVSPIKSKPLAHSLWRNDPRATLVSSVTKVTVWSARHKPGTRVEPATGVFLTLVRISTISTNYSYESRFVSFFSLNRSRSRIPCISALKMISATMPLLYFRSLNYFCATRSVIWLSQRLFLLS